MKPDLPPLRALHVFEVFGRCGSVSATAQELGVTAGAVSQQMKILENHLGQPLYSKEGGRPALLPEAKTYHQFITAGFDQLHRAQEVYAQYQSRADIKISGLPTLLLKWLNPRIHRFQAKVDGAAIHLEATHSEPEPHQYGTQFRLTYGAAAEAFPHKQALFLDHCFPVCSPEFLRQYPEARNPDQLRELPWIDIDWGPTYSSVPRLADWLAHQGVAVSDRPPQSVHSLSSLALEAAAGGQGVALAQASFAEFDLELGRLVRLSQNTLPMPAPYYVCWGSAVLQDPKAQAFLKWVLAGA
ncbi:LysR substrate-binding domain-containing protein [Pseudophaeobacter sp. EL27]|uniref:LysR substrate-binding domain-containing protein n=1 Tax=Pseudophaeobacter sp. EL27 TaxID=2107580 RepID=UPI0013C4A001|nr:LysR substrate-binding domain-containing protein [Pseudophaeobacter sp. EL27]